MAMGFSKNSLLLLSAPIGLQQPVCQYDWHTKKPPYFTQENTLEKIRAPSLWELVICEPMTLFGGLDRDNLKNYSLDLDSRRVRTGHH